MKQIITLITIFMLSINLLNGQVKLKDTLALNIYSQSYLKLQNMADCLMPMTTIEKRICANLEFQRVHKVLDDLIRIIVTDFKNDDLLGIKDSFLQSQQEWIERRNKELLYINGKIENMRLISKVHLETLTDLTVQRITVLEETMLD